MPTATCASHELAQLHSSSKSTTPDSVTYHNYGNLYTVPFPLFKGNRSRPYVQNLDFDFHGSDIIIPDSNAWFD